MTLSVKAFAITCGLLWGSGVFLATWWILILDGPVPLPTLVGRIYRGYSITPIGSMVGLLWGLVDGLLGGALFAWIYNRIVLRHNRNR